VILSRARPWREVTLVTLLGAFLPGCLLRATLPAQRGEKRLVLWEGTTLVGAAGAEVQLKERTPVQVVERKGGDCRVSVAGEIRVEGEVACSRLGLLTVRPTEVRRSPGGTVLLTLNGGILVAPREKRGEWVRVSGEAFSTFEGWTRAADLGVNVEKSWLAPGTPRFPWICPDGGWLFDRPAGRYLIWIPGPWCRVSLLQEKPGWVEVEYLDSTTRIVGWAEADSVVPDREPRFHPGARPAKLTARTPVFAHQGAKEPFAHLEVGVRVWASLTRSGMTLIQTQSEPVEIVGWVQTPALRE
jgi:hypothetical protein